MGSVVLLRGLSVWQPFPTLPVARAREPGRKCLCSRIAAGLGQRIPVRRGPGEPGAAHQSVRGRQSRARSAAGIGRRITVRDLLLVVQIAICAVLVTSSMVAVRGLVRSLHSNFGFEPRNAMLVDTDLSMAGYSGDSVPAMQKRMIDAWQTIPGVTSVGLADQPAAAEYGANNVECLSPTKRPI